jgi:dTDP-glucose 4,6-dehydratase
MAWTLHSPRTVFVRPHRRYRVLMKRFERVLVTGGAGFVGSHLCERLLARGSQVVCLDNLSTGASGNIAHLRGHDRFRFIEHDVSLGIPECGPLDLIMHLASPASPADYGMLPIETLRAGSLGTLHVAEAATEHHARLVLASTSEVYGDPLEHPQTETYWGNVNPIGPRSVYDEAKRFSEAVVAAYRRSFGTDAAIARIFNTYGPRMRADDGRMIPAFICQAIDGTDLTIHGDGSHTRAICYVDDTVDGLLALATSDHPGPVNLGSAVETTVLDIANTIRELVGGPSGTIHIEEPIDDPRRRCPDIGLARSALGWQPRIDHATGLRRTYEWFARHRADTAAPAVVTAASPVTVPTTTARR